jgi:hypothetical protein
VITDKIMTRQVANIGEDATLVAAVIDLNGRLERQVQQDAIAEDGIDDDDSF